MSVYHYVLFQDELWLRGWTEISRMGIPQISKSISPLHPLCVIPWDPLTQILFSIHSNRMALTLKGMFSEKSFYSLWEDMFHKSIMGSYKHSLTVAAF